MRKHSMFFRSLNPVRVVCAAVCALILSALLFGVGSFADDLVLCIDPGHGGDDSGAVSNVDGVSYQENSCNLKISLAVKKYLSEYPGVKIVMTRETLGEGLSLAQRVSFATRMGAHAVISIHNNSYSDSSARGSLVCAASSKYRPELTKATQELGKSILSCLEQIGLNNRGLYTPLANTETYNVTYPDGSVQDYYGIVMRSIRSGVPGIVVECAFISSPKDVRDYLSSDEKLDKIGKQIADGIANYYGLSKEVPYDTAARIPVDARHLTFDQPHLRALLYPYSGTVISGTDEAVISNSNGSPSVYLDYYGMAVTTDEFTNVVIKAKGKSGSALDVYFGYHDFNEPKDEFCFELELTDEYKEYVLDFRNLPEWRKAFNFFKFDLKSGGTFSLSGIEFRSGGVVNGIKPGKIASETPTPTPTPKPT
ncbi:MAG: N-acetylmuramoyl-L-alanine amidase, partial [Clostridia bacterium]|nr:N-acetylmuramoyl-L-alanine amidase [Clostridia bacterium]